LNRIGLYWLRRGLRTFWFSLFSCGRSGGVTAGLGVAFRIVLRGLGAIRENRGYFAFFDKYVSKVSFDFEHIVIVRDDHAVERFAVL
jgi:hypothetical protein